MDDSVVIHDMGGVSESESLKSANSSHHDFEVRNTLVVVSQQVDLSAE